MGQRGPTANPNSIRYQGRNRQKPRQTLADMPAERLGTARMPSWLSDDAKSFWRTYAPKLKDLGRLTRLDETAFALVADTYGQIRQLDAEIERLGLILEGPRGGQQANPLIRIRATCYRQFLEGTKQFGLNPAARERLKAPPEANERDPFELWLIGGKDRRTVSEPNDPRDVLRNDAQFDAKRAFLGPNAS